MAVVETPDAIARYLAHTRQATVHPARGRRTWLRRPHSSGATQQALRPSEGKVLSESAPQGTMSCVYHPETGLGARECTNQAACAAMGIRGMEGLTPTGVLPVRQM